MLWLCCETLWPWFFCTIWPWFLSRWAGQVQNLAAIAGQTSCCCRSESGSRSRQRLRPFLEAHFWMLLGLQLKVPGVPCPHSNLFSRSHPGRKIPLAPPKERCVKSCLGFRLVGYQDQECKNAEEPFPSRAPLGPGSLVSHPASPGSQSAQSCSCRTGRGIPGRSPEVSQLHTIWGKHVRNTWCLLPSTVQPFDGQVLSTAWLGCWGWKLEAKKPASAQRG